MLEPAEEPRKLFEVTIKVGAHSEEDLLQRLQCLRTDIAVYGLRSHLNTYTGIVEVETNDGQTEENYRKQLDLYIRCKTKRTDAQ